MSGTVSGQPPRRYRRTGATHRSTASRPLEGARGVPRRRGHGAARRVHRQRGTAVHRDRHLAAQSELQWVVSGYALTFGLLLVPAGRIGDVRGRRVVFVVALGLFTLASAACGLAPNGITLVIARLVQGLAGGSVTPQISATIQEMFQGRERGKAFGAFGTIVGIATAVGPLLGGVLIQIFGDADGLARGVLREHPHRARRDAAGLEAAARRGPDARRQAARPRPGRRGAARPRRRAAADAVRAEPGVGRLALVAAAGRRAAARRLRRLGTALRVARPRTHGRPRAVPAAARTRPARR